MRDLDITNASALKFNLDIAEMVESTCQPIFKCADITHFTYIKLFNDNTILRMANNIEWTKKYFERRFFNDMNFYQTKNSRENDIYTAFLMGEPKGEHHITLYNHNIWNGLIIVKKFLNHTDFFLFATQRENTKILNFYINNFDIFTRFILYFRNCFSDIINDYDSKNLIVTQTRKIIPQVKYDEKIEKFLDEIKINSYHLLDNIYLSQREVECLLNISRGRTMKEVAKIMDISPRTVECYIENMKRKTGFTSKSCLIKMFWETPNYIRNSSCAA